MFRAGFPDPQNVKRRASLRGLRQIGKEIDRHFIFADRNFLPIVRSFLTSISLVVDLLRSILVQANLAHRLPSRVARLVEERPVDDNPPVYDARMFGTHSDSETGDSETANLQTHASPIRNGMPNGRCINPLILDLV